MLVMTLQKNSIAKQIEDRTYHALLSKSNYAYCSVRFTIGYRRIMNALHEKNKWLLPEEGCIWGFATYPDDTFVRQRLILGYTIMFIDVDPRKCVFSDYDKFSDYVLEDSDDGAFICKDKKLQRNRCIQVSFTVDSIKRIEAVFEGRSEIIIQPTIEKTLSCLRLITSIKKKSSCGFVERFLEGFRHTFLYYGGKLSYIRFSLLRDDEIEENIRGSGSKGYVRI